MINHRLFEARSEYVQLHFSRGCNNCGDQLLVNCFDITNIYIIINLMSQSLFKREASRRVCDTFLDSICVQIKNFEKKFENFRDFEKKI